MTNIDLTSITQLLLGLKNLMPLGYCINWSPMLLWLYVGADATIAVAYFSIPLVLAYFIHQRQDIKFRSIYLLFTAFIAACGITHLFHIVVLWFPFYWLDAILKLISGIISITTAIVLIRILPEALTLPSHSQLETEIKARDLYAQQIKSTEEQLRSLTKHLHSLIEAIPDTIVFIDTNDRWLIANQPAKNLFHLHDIAWQEKTTQEITECCPEQNGVLKQLSKNLNLSWNDGPLLLFEQQIGDAEVAARHYEWRIVPINDADPEDSGRLILGRDITQSKKTAAILSLQSKALEAASNAILIVNPQGLTEWANAAYTRLTGYSLEELLGINPAPLVESEKHPQAFYDKMWQTIESGNIWQGESVKRRKNGDLYSEEQVITPVMDKQGCILHYIAIKQDITSRKQAEAELIQHRDHLEKLVAERTQELQTSRDEAERLSTVKSNFLANMSHEIRTPMNAVLGFCYLLEQRPLEEESQQLVRKIKGAGQSLLAIINDILDLSKMEVGKTEIEHAPFSLSSLLEQLAGLMTAINDNKSLELIINPLPLAIDQVIGDSLKIKQVLTNLIGNALKFTEQGEVELKLQLDSESEQHIYLRFSVRDTGIGISHEQQNEVFTAFTQADNSIIRRFGGSGLGLTISQKLVALMGGSLQVTSLLGQGSTFWFVLPLEKEHHVNKISARIKNFDLLIAEACENARAALINTVNSLGWTADAYDSGVTALSGACTRYQANNPYDILLLDDKTVDCNELPSKILNLKALQIEQKAVKDPIFILISANYQNNLPKTSGMLFVDGMITKPVTALALYNTICQAINQREQNSADVAVALLPNITKRLEGIKVLVVDDNELNRELVLYILEAEGAIVSLACDGQEALDGLFANPESIDIILMDLQMPRMDGNTATRHIRQEHRWRDLPIIALTADVYSSLHDNLQISGMNAFVTKPFNVEQLITLIQQLTTEIFVNSQNDDSKKGMKKVHLPVDHWH